MSGPISFGDRCAAWIRFAADCNFDPISETVMGRIDSIRRIVPEIGLYPTDDDRAAIVYRWNRRCFRNWRFHVAMFGVAIGMAVAAVPLGIVLRRFGAPPWLLGGMMGGLVGGGAVGFLNYLYRRPMARFVRADLVSRGIPVCLECGYDLRGQRIPRCPECGAGFDSALIQPKDNAPTSPGEPQTKS